ncbi:MAG: hypothetical protein KBT30_02475 [Clostridiales bacterium]|nr:hypothetical protein [Candidatus Apopatousia equi]
MKNSNKKDLYNVDALKEAYQKSVEYLDELKKYAGFKNSIKSKMDNYSNDLKKELELLETENEYKQIQEKLQKMGSLDSAYEKYYNGEIPSNEVEKILEVKKEDVELKKILNEKRNTFKKSVKEFNNKLLLETKTEYENLKQSVIDKGMESMCFSPKKWLNDEKEQFTPGDLADFYDDKKTFEKNIEWFKQKFLTNSFYYSNGFNTDVDRIGDYQMIRVWFDSANAPLKFTNKKIVKDLPSPYEFYISKLNKQYNKNFETITIVSNDFSKEYWKYEDVLNDEDFGSHYFVYVANLIAPKVIAEKLKNTEKQQTKKSIEKLVKKYPEINILKEEDFEYGKTNYKLQFTEELREKIRKKFGKNESNSSENFCELFGYFDSDDGYHYYGDTPIVNVPDKRIANAIFETLEYMNKLEKIKHIRHTKNKLDDTYEELLNE